MNNEANSSSKFHTKFDDMVKGIMETVRDQLVEQLDADDLSHEAMIGQMLMIECEDLGSVDTKQRLVAIADHLGPDHAQALYHAAVFITKVA